MTSKLHHFLSGDVKDTAGRADHRAGCNIPLKTRETGGSVSAETTVTREVSMYFFYFITAAVALDDKQATGQSQ